MSLRKETKRSLDELVDRLASTPGVTLILLFGSYARGEADEGSDIDLLLFFSSKEKRRRHQDEVYEATAASGLFTQTICLDPEDIMKVSPVFLSNVFEEGVLLAVKTPLQLPADALLMKRFALVTYNLSGLPPRRKQTFLYEAYGKTGEKYSYPGLIHKLGGIKIGRSSFAVPWDNLPQVENLLDRHDVGYEARPIYTSPPLSPEISEHLHSMLGEAA